MNQDAAYGFRMLVDIAERSLSESFDELIDATSFVGDDRHEHRSVVRGVVDAGAHPTVRREPAVSRATHPRVPPGAAGKGRV